MEDKNNAKFEFHHNALDNSAEKNEGEIEGDGEMTIVVTVIYMMIK